MGSTSGGTNVTRSFVLNTERHAHLIRFLTGLEARSVSRVVREALELYIDQGRPAVLTVGDVETACQKAVERALEGRIVGLGQPVDSELSGQRPETQASRGLAEMRDALEEWE